MERGSMQEEVEHSQLYGQMMEFQSGFSQEIIFHRIWRARNLNLLNGVVLELSSLLMIAQWVNSSVIKLSSLILLYAVIGVVLPINLVAAQVLALKESQTQITSRTLIGLSTMLELSHNSYRNVFQQ